MSLPLSLVRIRKYFARAIAGGATMDELASSLDAMLADIIDESNKAKQRLEAISTTDGRLSGLSLALAQALAGTQRFVAVAGQTIFNTTIAWDPAFNNLNVPVHIAGALLDPNLVVVANSEGIAQVTLPPRAAGELVVISAFSSGAGIAAKLNSAQNNQGASLVGIEDAGAFTTQTNVEGALQEIYAHITDPTYLTAVLALSQFLRVDGSRALTGDMSAGTHKITNLGAGIAASNDAARMADITAANLLATILPTLVSLFLASSGGAMTGDIQMGGHKITGLGAGTATGDATNWDQWMLTLHADGSVPATGTLNMGTHRITGVATATSPSDAVPLSQAQALVSSFARMNKITAPGPFSWVVPDGVTQIKTRQWAAGAGGGNSVNGSGTVRYGGGSGAYIEATVPVVPGETLTGNIGMGGVGGGAPADGGDTSLFRGVTQLLLARGGKTGATTGLGGTFTFDGSLTAFGIVGGDGRAGLVNTSNGDVQMIGDGADAPMGGQGGTGFLYNFAQAQPGHTPGGGGGCGVNGAGVPAAGADGALIISY